MGTFGLTLANRGVIIGAVTVPELFDMAKRGEDSDAFDAVWVGDSLLAKPRLESITLLSALAAVTKKVRLAVGCMATFPHRHPALLAQQWASLGVISGGRAWLAVCLGGPNEQSPAQALEHKYNEGAYDDLQPIAAQIDSAYSAAAIQLKARYRLPA